MHTPRLPDRRHVLRTTGLLGLAAAAAPWSAPARAADTPLPALTEFEHARVDWQAYKGQAIVVGAIEHPWTVAVAPLIPRFEALTGVSVRVLKQSETDYVSGMTARMQAKASTPDVLMVHSPIQYIGNGWLAPLDPLYANRRLFDAAWFNQADIFPMARSIAVWTDGRSYSQSVTVEAQILYANAAMLAQAGLAAPTTFDTLYQAAVKTKTAQRTGISMRWNPPATDVWVLAGFIFSNGGAIMNGGHCVFDSDAAAEAVEFYVRVLRDAGPRRFNHGWYEVLRDFTQADAAIFLDTSIFTNDIAASPMARSTVYAPMPGNGKRPAEANVWAWQVGINAASQRKEAAFLFLCFVNSVAACRFTSASGLSTPRPSAWATSAFRERFGKAAAEATLASIQSQAPAKFKAAWQHPRSPTILAGLAKALDDCSSGSVDVRASLKAQAAMVNQALLKK